MGDSKVGVGGKNLASCVLNEVEDKRHFLLDCEGCVSERRNMWAGIRSLVLASKRELWEIINGCFRTDKVKILLGGICEVRQVKDWLNIKKGGRKELLVKVGLIKEVKKVVVCGVSKMLRRLAELRRIRDTLLINTSRI